MKDKNSHIKKSLKAWVKIKDYESALEAIRQTYIIAFVLAAMHGVLLLLLIVGWNEINEKVEYALLGLYLVVTLLVVIPLAIGFRIKNKKLGLAPLLIIWGCAEGVYIVFKYFFYSVDNDGSNGFLTMIIYSMFGIIAMRGFNAFEAYNQIREGIVKKEVSPDERE